MTIGQVEVSRGLQVSFSASGAYLAGLSKMVVVIVDIVDMSTTAESARESGAAHVTCCALAGIQPPVPVDPFSIARDAGILARENNWEVVLITEPRVGSDEERQINAAPVIAGLKESNIEPVAIIPNIGYESAKMVDMREKLVIISTASGGVAFDAAKTAGAKAVLTATVARTAQRNGRRNLEVGAKRAIETAVSLNAPIAVIAASHNALEDINGAYEVAREIMRCGFLDL